MFGVRLRSRLLLRRIGVRIRGGGLRRRGLLRCLLLRGSRQLLGQYLRQNQLSLRVWPDYPAIVATCCQAWNALMAMPERLASITRREWAKPVTS